MEKFADPVLRQFTVLPTDFSPMYLGRYWIRSSLKYVRKMPLESFSMCSAVYMRDLTEKGKNQSE